MSGKKATPDQSTQAVILREAGYTLPAIATRLELSISTVQRILKTNKAVAGASTQCSGQLIPDTTLSFSSA
jgi:DNA invertase Pin-like site-specific DNA recombinase